MKSFALAALAIVAAAAVVAPANAQTPPRDTGSMAYPAPLPQGNVGTSAGPRAPDTGSASTPAPVPERGPTANVPPNSDTGSMAYPAPLPQGNLGTTSTAPK